MIWNVLNTARELGRLYDIATVLIAYGFGEIVQRVGLGDALKYTGKILHWRQAEEWAHLSLPQRLRRVLEALGPTFIKLGQLLSTRVDLFPPDWITEFEKLQSEAQALDFAELRSQLEADLGAPPGIVFAEVDTEPLGAASIAQVHGAKLADGTPVVLKIRRPGITSQVESDLRLLTYFAELAEERLPDLRFCQPKALIRNFARMMRRELDLAAECRYAERIAANMADHQALVIPKIYWQWTSERLNVQEYLAGIPVWDCAALDAAGLDRKALARRGAAAVLTMMIRDGVFHADPHPGNIRFLPDNRIALLDFGMVGHLSNKRRYQVIDFLSGLFSRHTDRAVNVLMAWSDQEAADREQIQEELEAFVDRYHGASLRQIEVSTLLLELAALFRDHHLAMPPEFALVLKIFVAVEGIGRQLDPDFNMTREMEPILRQAARARYAPDVLARQAWTVASDLVELLNDLPHELRRVMSVMRGEGLRHHLVLDQLDTFGKRLHRAASLLAISLVTAAFILGTSFVVAMGQGPMVFGVSIYELFSIGAVFGGIWVVLMVWRGGRR